MTSLRDFLGSHRDPEYISELRRIAIPVVIQQFTFSGLNMLGVVFVGQKGDQAVAAVGLAGQIAFILNHTNTFLYTVRSPVRRIVSAFNYHRHEATGWSKAAARFFTECYADIEELGQPFALMLMLI